MDRSWRMIVDHYKPTKIVILIPTAVPHVASYMSILTYLLPPGMQLLLSPIFSFSIPVHKDYRKQLAFSWQGLKGLLILWPSFQYFGHLISFTRCHIGAPYWSWVSPWVTWSRRSTNTWGVSGRQGFCPKPLAGPLRWLTLGTYAITAFPLRGSFCTAIGHLIMNYQVAMHLKLSPMSWLLFGPSGHKIGCVQQQSTIQWRWL